MIVFILRRGEHDGGNTGKEEKSNILALCLTEVEDLLLHESLPPLDSNVVSVTWFLDILF